MRQYTFLGPFLLIWGALMLAALAGAGRDGQPVKAASAILLVSPVLILLLRLTLERNWVQGRELSTYSLGRQSWAFLLGDTIALPFTAAILAVAWRKLDVSEGRWFQQWWWLPLCIAIGLVLGYCFHFILDTPAYIEAGVKEALNSPTKWAHDFVSYPVISAGLLYLGVPVLVDRFWPYGVLGLAGIVLWLSFGVRDMYAGLNPADFHPRWDVSRFDVIQ